jgi:hypothetical protein
LLEGNKSLLAERNNLRDRIVDPESALAEAKAAAAKDISALDAKVVSAESHILDEAAAGENVLLILKQSSSTA